MTQELSNYFFLSTMAFVISTVALGRHVYAGRVRTLSYRRSAPGRAWRCAHHILYHHPTTHIKRGFHSEAGWLASFIINAMRAEDMGSTLRNCPPIPCSRCRRREQLKTNLCKFDGIQPKLATHFGFQIQTEGIN